MDVLKTTILFSMNKPHEPTYPVKLVLRDILSGTVLGLSILPFIPIHPLRGLPFYIYFMKFVMCAVIFHFFKVYTKSYRNLDCQGVDLYPLVGMFMISGTGVLFSNHPIFILIFRTSDVVLGSNLISETLFGSINPFPMAWEMYIVAIFRFLVLFPLIVLYDWLIIGSDKDCCEYGEKLQKYLAYFEMRQKVELQILQEAKEEQAAEDSKLRKREEEVAKEYEENLHLITMDRLDWETQMKSNNGHVE